MNTYILRDRVPVPEPDVRAWARWCNQIENRRVALTYLCDGALCVYTTFLGSDHRFGGEGPPVLFETMIEDQCSGEWWDVQWRYSSWDDAERGHQDACAFVMESLQHV